MSFVRGAGVGGDFSESAIVVGAFICGVISLEALLEAVAAKMIL
jgi:hypothetical protein